MKPNPIEITNYIKHEYLSFLSNRFSVDDPDYQKQIQQSLENEDLFHGPYVKTVLPFVKGDSVRELVEKDILDPEFLKLSGIDFDRPLYSHQAEAINKAASGRNLIITTGTGSGKTESFLFPILNHILKIKKTDKSHTVKALFLYPMNALVNDQLDRIRDILRSYPDITFGRYIGDTQETSSKSSADNVNQKHPSNELLTRDELRKTPPDILVTNYSMLEFLLIRPADNSIINPSAMKDWQFLILDEAHTYTGTKGTEISYLLRRLKGFTRRDPQFILTSATLGDQDSVQEIINFGQNLTSSSYSDSDIIFAHRIPLDEQNIRYRSSPSLYSEIADRLENRTETLDLMSACPECSSVHSSEENLYYFLLHDANIYDLFNCARDTASFDDILKSMPAFQERELISLIRLLCLAKTDSGDFLFDAKYHFFISSPSTAFITLGKNKEFRFGNQTTINGLKAFEIGRCKRCSHMYLVGKIVNGILEPADSLDPYESYEDSTTSGLTMFSLTDTIEESENAKAGSDTEELKLTQYQLCPECGAIAREGCTPDCGHTEEQMVAIYEIPRSLTFSKNYTRCPHCGGRSTTGMIHSLHLDQSTATSVLGNIFINALGDDVSVSAEDQNDQEQFDLFSEEWNFETEEPQTGNTKQILAFSDGRQQASYFAVSMERIHDRAVKKHMVLDELKKLSPLPLLSLASRMETTIKNGDLFENRPQAEAWIGILQDLLFLEGERSPEKLGLYTYRYLPIQNNFKSIKKGEASVNKNFNMTPEEFISLLNYAVEFLRRKLVINYSSAELTEDERGMLTDFPLPERFVKGEIERKKKSDSRTQKSVDYVSMLPVNKRGSNRITNYLRKVTGISDPEVLRGKTLLLFKLMKKLGCFGKSKSPGTEDHLQLDLTEFSAVSGASVQWYQCSKCKRITTINIKNICPEPDCTGTLVPCNPALLFEDNFYYREYTTIPVERIRVKEHTAQLSNQQAKEYQDRFKSKDINLLSCSTTFEVGVDIGSLENVMMRNMPPSPANYVQRAGRAGRGKDSSALVLTYCTNRSHDYSYFMSPEVMIDGMITPPVFSTENQKIVIRHIIATALGLFLRKNPEKYDDRQFVFGEGMADFFEYLSNQPADLGEFLDRYLLSAPSMSNLRNFGWVDELLSDESHLRQFVDHMQSQVYEYNQAILEASNNQNFSEADFLQKALHRIENQNLIELLSAEAVIPKYGFPVDVVELKRNNQLPGDYNLSRDLRIAISEYAPSSEIVVDKKKITSRYINLPKATQLERKYYVTCPSCRSTNISITEFSHSDTCSNCGETLLNGGTARQYLVPSLGFTAEFTESSVVTKPKRVPSGDIRYIGNGVQGDKQYNYRHKVIIQSLIQDELAVLNESNFYYCPKCGYTESFPFSGLPAPQRDFRHKEHKDRFGRPCSCKKGDRITLGHVFKTDVVILNFTDRYSLDELITTGFALRLGLHNYLQIELEDVDTTVIGTRATGYQLILFDNVPGGAGYVRKLLDERVFTGVIKAAYDAVSHDCCDEETTCYKCLRTYYNQKFHKVMKRRYAREILSDLMGESEYE